MKLFKKKSIKKTNKIAINLSKLLHAGDLILLCGSLGSGKTTFIRQLVYALSNDKKFLVNSPTFTILQEYHGHGLPFPIYHFDAYRLKEIGSSEQGFEDYINTDGLTLIEWPEFMKEILPKDYLAIKFIYDGKFRDIKISALGKHYSNILNNLFKN